MVAPVPANFRRYLPLLLVGLLLVTVVPGLLRKKSTSAVSAGTLAQQTIKAMKLIDTGEQAYLSANGRFTPHLADLLTGGLANDLALGVVAQIDVGTGGQRYLAQVASPVLSLVRGQSGAKMTAQSCLVLKSGSGVACPLPAK